MNDIYPGSTAGDTAEEDAPVKREGDRVAKVIARAGVASRREAEALIEEGRVAVNGIVLDTPAVIVTAKDEVRVDGDVIPQRLRTRAFLFHKPRGLVTTNRDPEGRPTVFEALPASLPRVVTVGRLDINTEGLLILTNDGGLARVLELPATGWTRKYRVRVYGAIDEAALAGLREGTAVDGVLYGPIDVTLDRQQNDTAWLTVSLTEGKNREVKIVLGSIGLQVTRLIRVSFGPFQLGDLPRGEVREIPSRQLREQLGPRLIEEAEADFEAPVSAPAKTSRVGRTSAKDNRAPAGRGAHSARPGPKADRRAPRTFGADGTLLEDTAPRSRPQRREGAGEARDGREGRGDRPRGPGRDVGGRPHSDRAEGLRSGAGGRPARSTGGRSGPRQDRPDGGGRGGDRRPPRADGRSGGVGEKEARRPRSYGSRDAADSARNKRPRPASGGDAPRPPRRADGAGPRAAEDPGGRADRAPKRRGGFSDHAKGGGGRRRDTTRQEGAGRPDGAGRAEGRSRGVRDGERGERRFDKPRTPNSRGPQRSHGSRPGDGPRTPGKPGRPKPGGRPQGRGPARGSGSGRPEGGGGRPRPKR